MSRSFAFDRELLHWLARGVVAGVFIYAAVPKLLDPAAFAEDVSNYGLPNWTRNFTAAVIPPLELVGALALLWPRRQTAGAVILGGLLLGFTALILSVIVRGIDISCGCFGKASASDPIGWIHVLRNVALFIALLFGAAKKPLLAQRNRE